ncbi:MAG: ABC transporter ATP-binding protein [Paenibacillus macerans]|uniref:Carnitine transport ATP-binding protein OpuCA n=2 Tax=Paenibacillus macerans TaxID=44252 RepID=A0A090ZJH6_PAEMA|nr:ABC transporter ATP-binding protein [Paenibacillus macerans]KFN10538.1 ABC transporter family protein [Paenibacillus macerans]MCY7561963.1 ABC transporter ATP-binding protein [Paenibacillus macerans]MDU7473433.1 ABC transporter ATP-binding protein [Paenibacillus macerans]MEC0149548.1 ABC transporter ATP-binding protein [Paenibacillus macerans]MEC0332567.1 ABC transporter ATP-binding protein [Paenibacillus macerans]
MTTRVTTAGASTIGMPATGTFSAGMSSAGTFSAGTFSTETPSAGTLLEIRGLTKRYGSFQALGGVSFDMKEGEIISVLGPSGCGKSTLLQLIAGLSRPDDGEIRLKGETIASPGGMVPPERRNVNMVFQDYALWPHMNVFDNVAYGLRKLGREEKAARVGELLELLHLGGLERRLPPQLSGGQQQRVAIARALATRPKLILLDEPLSNLDMRLRIEMRAEMAYLFRKLGMSVFHVTHDPEEAFSMADRLLILRGGAIDQIGTPQECFTRPASPWVASLLGAINRLPGLLERSGGYAIRIGGAGSGNDVPRPEGATRIEGAAGPECSGLPDGAAAELLFRPEQLRLIEGGVAAEGREGENLLPVNVVHCTFEGTRWRVMAETDTGHKLYVLSASPLPVNTRHTVMLPKANAYIYAARQNEERKVTAK